MHGVVGRQSTQDQKGIHLIFRQLIDDRSSTYSYLLADEGEAILIDPVFEQARRDSALITELGLTLLYTLDTHIHADHISGAWLLKQHLGSQIAISGTSGATGFDLPMTHGRTIRFGGRSIEVRETPGHTSGCLTFVLDDETMAFTGDALLIRGAGRTDFQEGNARLLFDSLHSEVFTLPDDCLVYPSHDYMGRTCSSVGEERQHNPRVGEGASVGDFIGFMDNLGLPHPHQIELAVPANLRCGQPESEEGAPKEPTWAPLRFTFAGSWEVEPEWVEEHPAAAQLIDVRFEDEFNGELGHIKGALNIPISDLPDRFDELDREKPVIVICRSGARSTQAAVLMASEGFSDVANLNGGMVNWRSAGLPTVGGR